MKIVELRYLQNNVLYRHAEIVDSMIMNTIWHWIEGPDTK